MGKGTACALWTSALEIQPRTPLHCPCAAHHHKSVCPAGVSSPCIMDRRVDRPFMCLPGSQGWSCAIYRWDTKVYGQSGFRLIS